MYVVTLLRPKNTKKGQVETRETPEGHPKDTKQEHVQGYDLSPTPTGPERYVLRAA